jgi:hypothetical protein
MFWLNRHQHAVHTYPFSNWRASTHARDPETTTPSNLSVVCHCLPSGQLAPAPVAASVAAAAAATEPPATATAVTVAGGARLTGETPILSILLSDTDVLVHRVCHCRRCQQY